MRKNYIKLNDSRAVHFDLDDTLIIWNTDTVESKQYLGNPLKFDAGVLGYPHLKHIEILKQFRARGQQIVVWSGGGSDYAEKMLNKLDILKYVDVVMSKPEWVFDDLDQAIPKRTFLK